MATSALYRLLLAGLLGLMLGAASCSCAPSGSFRAPNAAPPNAPTLPAYPRPGPHTAMRLRDGRVWVQGGGTAPDEIYDPSTNSWSVAGWANAPRGFATKLLLPDGRILAIASANAATVALVFDPATDTAIDTHAPEGLSSDTATLLADGTVLVVSVPVARTSNGIQARPARYDPVANRWLATGELPWRPPESPSGGAQSTTRLLDGRVLVTRTMTAELYDPVTNTWRQAARLPARASGHSGTLLPTGEVLLVGGTSGTDLYDSGRISRGGYRYDPQRDTWTEIPEARARRHFPTLTMLPDGRVMAWGGYPHTAMVDIYEPAPANSWSPAADLPFREAAIPDENVTATVLDSGLVLFIGKGGLALYDPASDRWSRVTLYPSVNPSRAPSR